MEFTANQERIITFFKLSLFIIAIPLSFKLSFWITDSFIFPYNKIMQVAFGFMIVIPIYAVTFFPIMLGFISVIGFSLNALVEKISFLEKAVSYIEPHNQRVTIMFWILILLCPYAFYYLLNQIPFFANINISNLKEPTMQFRNFFA